MDTSSHPIKYEGTQLLQPKTVSTAQTPLIICFHGSGETCASWLDLAQLLAQRHRVLLYDRGAANPVPKTANADLRRYLDDAGLGPPYVLIGHSYGGTFARDFLQQRPRDVAGLVLAETGQETALDPATEARQYKRPILGAKPLSVIRANSMIGKMRQLEEQIMALQGDKVKVDELRRSPEFAMVRAWDEEDERLKRRQLGLSTNSRYRHVPDCGHHVIRDRPDVVAEEVSWVMENCLEPEKPQHGFMKLLGKLKR